MRFIVVLTVLVTALAAPVALAQAPFPDTIPLPNGWQPEGIDVGDGSTFYAGSIPIGSIYRGDLRRGTGSVLVQRVPCDGVAERKRRRPRPTPSSRFVADRSERLLRVRLQPDAVNSP